MLATEKSSLRERYRYHNLFIDKKYKYISYIKESQTYIHTYLKKKSKVYVVIAFPLNAYNYHALTS